MYMSEGGEYEGKAAIAVVGDLQDLADSSKYPYGPLLRLHSACSYSEVGPQKETPAIGWLEMMADYSQPFIAENYMGRTLYIEDNAPRWTLDPSFCCDCSLQMQTSQDWIANGIPEDVELDILPIQRQPGGIYVDLMEQEGRGYGLLNKQEFFYRLGDELELDTAEICDAYNIEYDLRRYDTVVSALAGAGITRVQLLGNNPRKKKALEKAGITVTVINLELPTEGNISYLRTKRDKLGHVISDDEKLTQLIDRNR